MDFEARKIRVEATKSDRIRERQTGAKPTGDTGYVSERTADLLRRWKSLHKARGAGKGMKARRNNGKEIDGVDLSEYAWPIANREKGRWLSWRRFHTIQRHVFGKARFSARNLRQSFTERVYARTGNPQVVADALRHSDVKTTRKFYLQRRDTSAAVVQELCDGATADAMHDARAALRRLPLGDRVALFHEFGLGAAAGDLPIAA